jgi:hypothetical protein
VIAVIALAAVGLRVDTFDATHPTHTQLMYALDADTGQARWLSTESSPQKWTSQYVSGSPGSFATLLPAFGPEKLLTGPAAAATLAAPQVTVLADTRTGDSRQLRLLARPQRPVRLLTLHVAADVTVSKATVGGRDVPVDQLAGGGWGFGFVFHAPPAAGLEVTLTVRAPGQVRLRAMDASDGLSELPGFRARPANVGIVGSHNSEMCAVAKTYAF